MVCCLQETHFSFKATHRLRVKRWRKIFQANINQKNRITIPIPLKKIDFKLKLVRKDKEDHYIMIKGTIKKI